MIFPVRDSYLATLAVNMRLPAVDLYSLRNRSRLIALARWTLTRGGVSGMDKATRVRIVSALSCCHQRAREMIVYLIEVPQNGIREF